MVRLMYNGGTKGFIHVIAEQYFEDPWLSLAPHCSWDNTTGDLPKEETAGVQLIATTPFPTAAFNSLICPSTPPYCLCLPQSPKH